MTDNEVLDAERRGCANGYVIQVHNHKTAMTFGAAQLALTANEFSWVKRWMNIKQGLPGRQNNYLLCTTGDFPSNHLHEHWLDIGLCSPITSTILRTSLADN
ncbi:hypothetical protein KUCAC02_016613, partial [Chaenocephalus aceratus]